MHRVITHYVNIVSLFTYGDLDSITRGRNYIIINFVPHFMRNDEVALLCITLALQRVNIYSVIIIYTFPFATGEGKDYYSNFTESS